MRSAFSSNQESKSTKQQFALGSDTTSYQLPASSLATITAHYQKKFGIKIIINGETALSQRIIKKRTENLLKPLRDLTDDALKYASFLRKFWKPPINEDKEEGRSSLVEPWQISNLSTSSFSKVYGDIQKLISPFLTPLGELRADIDERALNEALKGSSFSSLFDVHIQQYMEYFKKKADDLCLNKTEALEEVRRIQQNLGPHEYVGYIYTNNHRQEEDHFEILIISREKVIKPVSWGRQGNPDKSINNDDLHDSYFSVDQLELNLMPQAGHVECGTLGILYLKELLKNAAAQLENDCLSFSFYQLSTSGKPEIQNFYFPSPQVLRYSQSGAYNRYLKDILESKDAVTFNHRQGAKVHELRLRSIEQLLRESLELAKTQNNQAIVDQNQKILDLLPRFREKWLKAYEVAGLKREALTDQLALNRYLAYRSRKMAEKVAQLPPLKLIGKEQQAESLVKQCVTILKEFSGTEALVEQIQKLWFKLKAIEDDKNRCSILLGFIIQNANIAASLSTNTTITLFASPSKMDSATSILSKTLIEPWVSKMGTTQQQCEADYALYQRALDSAPKYAS